MRTALSSYAAVEPRDWCFATNQHGRPELAPGQCSLPLRFNLSHADGLIACAVTLDRDIGVDVERERPVDDLARLAARFFAPVEAAALSALPEPQRVKRFFAYWTLKESYIKARGLGLAIPLDKFWFDDLEQGRARVLIDPSLADDPALWQFAMLRPTPDHQLAVAVRRSGPDLAVVVRWRTPGSHVSHR